MTHAARSAPRPTLVIGGAGFIGAQVVEALLERGAEVRVLDDLSTGRPSQLPLHDPNLELRVGDMHDPEAVAEAMRGMRAVVHLAAAPSGSAADPHEVALSNVLGFINVLDAARQHRPERLVYASSAALRADAPAQSLAPDALEKLISEGYASLYGRQYRLPTLGLRYGAVRGSRHGARRGAPVENVAAATVAALGSATCGVCELGVPAAPRAPAAPARPRALHARLP